MNHIGTDVEEYLASNDGVSAIIGSGDDAQIFEQGIPQGATDRFVVYQLFGGQNFEHLYGEAGLGQTRFQIDCYGACEADAAELAEQVRHALIPYGGYHGPLGSFWIDSITLAQTMRTGHDTAQDGSDVRRYWASQDFLITHSISLPT